MVDLRMATCPIEHENEVGNSERSTCKDGRTYRVELGRSKVRLSLGVTAKHVNGTADPN